MGNGSSEESIRSQCVLGNDNRRSISTVEEEVKEVKRDYKAADAEIKKDLADSQAEQWGVINQLRDRLPPWATFATAGLSAVASAAITIAISAIF